MRGLALPSAHFPLSKKSHLRRTINPKTPPSLSYLLDELPTGRGWGALLNVALDDSGHWIFLPFGALDFVSCTEKVFILLLLS